MGHPQRVQATDVWILTDIYGRVQAISSEARAALGAPPIGRGDDLVKRFPSRTKALMFDMEVALTGWATERTIIVGRDFETATDRPLPRQSLVVDRRNRPVLAFQRRRT